MAVTEHERSDVDIAQFPFVLPHGVTGPDGHIHRDGIMRLATAADEIAPLADPRVRSNPAYLVLILMSRVVTSLGDLEFITPQVFEHMYAGDLAHLQDLYQRINRYGDAHVAVTCPHCSGDFEVAVELMGG